ncbi:MAG: glycosyltransferase [Lachnospiraceae bacterium]|nr:glycosyltransferase [Lachnospiraceae bacterium]
MPFLSIIIPVYNVEKYIEKCIESILNQTFLDYECILVDDGSKDSSGTLCDEYAEKDQRIKVIHKSNGGLVSARQAGIQIATGEYVGYVDSDDFIHADMYFDMCERAREHSADIVVCDLQDYVDGEELHRNPSLMEWEGLYFGKKLKEELIPNSLSIKPFFNFGVAPSLCNKIIRRKLLLQHQLEVKAEISLGEDACCSYFCLLEADKVFFCKERYYYYRKNENSITQSFDSQKYIKTIDELNFFWNKLQKYNDEQFKIQFLQYASHMMTNIVYDHLRLGYYRKNFSDMKMQYELLSRQEWCGQIVTLTKQLHLPFHIKSYINLVMKRTKYALICANIKRIIAGARRRLK